MNPSYHRTKPTFRRPDDIAAAPYQLPDPMLCSPASQTHLKISSYIIGYTTKIVEDHWPPGVNSLLNRIPPVGKQLKSD